MNVITRVIKRFEVADALSIGRENSVSPVQSYLQSVYFFTLNLTLCLFWQNSNCYRFAISFISVQSSDSKHVKQRIFLFDVKLFYDLFNLFCYTIFKYHCPTVILINCLSMTAGIL